MTEHGEYEISCDKERLDVGAIHAFLERSYWSPGARRSKDRRSEGNIELALFRGRGLGKRLVEFIMAHQELQGLRRFMLVTRDAHGLYGQFGFGPVATPERLMEILDPDLYLTR